MRQVRVLVTGGAGFIGAHLVRRLLREGHQAAVLDDLSSGVCGTAGCADLLAGDVRDPDVVVRAARGVDAIVHLAAVVGVRRTLSHPWDTITTSTVGTFNVLRAARTEGCPCIVASSSSVYGKNARVPLDEDDGALLGSTGLGAWTYAYAKAAEESLCLAAWHEFRQPCKVIRLFNVVGPGQGEHHGMVLPRFVGCALRGDPLVVYGDGSQTRTFVDIEDALDGIVRVWRDGDWGHVYNVGGTEEIRIVDLAAMVVGQTSSSSRTVMLPFDLAYDAGFEETMRRMPDLRRLRALGYAPRFTLRDMIARIAQDFKERAAQ